jgi:hypothetical protein
LAKRASVVARPQSQKLEPLAETTRRACVQRAQSPTAACSAALSDGLRSGGITLARSLRSGERGQRKAKALEKLLDPTHGCFFL